MKLEKTEILIFFSSYPDFVSGLETKGLEVAFDVISQTLKFAFDIMGFFAFTDSEIPLD